MAKGFLYGSGGSGGVGLNFKVVNGYDTPPSNPTENTIWVNTGVAITSWMFSATQPENPSQGMVWFSVGTSSPMALNALKKNTIMMYPISAKIYNSGAWSEKEAKTYRNGEWVAWFPEGAIYVDGAFAMPVVAADRGGSGRGTVTPNDGYFLLKMGTASYSAQAITESPVSIDGFTTMTVTYNSVLPVNSGTEVKLFANTTKADSDVLPASVAATGKTSGTLTLDLSKLGTGSYYLAVSIWHSSIMEVRITDWRLNK